MKQWLVAVDAELQKILPLPEEKPALLHKAMRHSIFPGGKRLRPLLCIAACDAVGSAAENALPAAAAVELLHTYTLVHDDLPCMDDDSTRRGKPTVHIKYGEALAVLAGDALLTLAFETAAGSACNPAHIAATLARYAGSRGVIAGQVMDITTRQPDVETIKTIHQRKTADLIVAAVQMGAIAGNASVRQKEALINYATNVGVAFQIIDDVLDSKESAEDTELSCMQIWSHDDARKYAAEHTTLAIKALSGFPPDRRHILCRIAEMSEKRSA